MSAEPRIGGAVQIMFGDDTSNVKPGRILNSQGEVNKRRGGGRRPPVVKRDKLPCPHDK